MAFYWKFTRSGMYSRRYISLIIDATPDTVNDSKNVWHTSFEELGMLMILLQDVEVNNVPDKGPTKPAFRDVVRSLGYEPTIDYKMLRGRFNLVKGKAVMGRHDGEELDWGYYSNKLTPIDVSIADFQVGCYIDAATGRRNAYDQEDKLFCFRGDPEFRANGVYFDLMPKHIVMVPIVKSMLATDKGRTERFLFNLLKWKPLV